MCKKVLKNSHFLKQQVLIIGRILSAASCCGKFICKKFYFRGIFFPSDPDFDVFTHLKSSAIKLDQAVAAGEVTEDFRAEARRIMGFA